MKKVFGLLFVAGLFVFASCGNSEEAATETETTVEETTVEEAPLDETTLEEDTTGMEMDADTAATL